MKLSERNIAQNELTRIDSRHKIGRVIIHTNRINANALAGNKGGRGVQERNGFDGRN